MSSYLGDWRSCTTGPKKKKKIKKEEKYNCLFSHLNLL